MKIKNLLPTILLVYLILSFSTGCGDDTSIIPVPTNGVTFTPTPTTVIPTAMPTAIPTEPIGQGTWQELSPLNPPFARSEHTMVTIDGDIYLFGGYADDTNISSSQVLDELWKFNKDNSQWEKKAPSQSPSPRKAHSAVVYNNKMIIFGGTDAANTPLNDIWSYDPYTNTWEDISPVNRPPARSYHTAVMASNEMIITGGFTPPGTYMKDTWSYDMVNNVWSQKADFTGDENMMYGAAGAYNNGYFYIFGTTGNSLYRYNVSTETWDVTTVGNPPPSRELAGVAQVGSMVYLFGGAGTSSFYKDSWALNLTDNVWTQVADMPYPVISGKATATGQGIIYFGGMGSDLELTNKTILFGEQN